MMPWAPEDERTRRDGTWKTLLSSCDPGAVVPHLLSDLGLRPLRTAQGIYRAIEKTAELAPPYGVTLSLLYAGRAYDDTFDDNCGLYAYPSTERGARDEAEIEATKNAHRLHLPVFAVLPGPSAELRAVRRGWIEDWDDRSQVFLISFGKEPEDPVAELDDFELTAARTEPRTKGTRVRPGQVRFRFDVFRRYGPRCAVCPVDTPVLLEAVHLCGVEHGGRDDSRNGMVLCRNHHRALDERLFGIEPSMVSIVVRRTGPSASSLGIAAEDLRHLPALPHRLALEWCWNRFRGAKDVGQTALASAVRRGPRRGLEA